MDKLAFPNLAADKIMVDDAEASIKAAADWVEKSLTIFFQHLAQQEKTAQATLRQDENNLSLLDGARYVLLNGDGAHPAKRLRPWFVFLASAACGNTLEQPAFPKFYHAALAIELIHNYSLIHDDLPAMDDDKQRRGKATLHVAFPERLSSKTNEAFAILVGDVLQGLAFELIATSPNLSAELSNRLVIDLARAAGFGGMVSGQWRDMMGAETMAQARLLKAQKTGALIEFSLTAPLRLAQQQMLPATQLMWRELASQVGLLYQAVDDILDEVSTSAAMGKKTGKDKAAGKATTIALVGMAAAQKEVEDCAANIQRLISTIKEDKRVEKIALDCLANWCRQILGKLRF